MKIETPTGLELRFEREMKAVIPGWKSEFPEADVPIEPPAPRTPPGQRRLPRHRPHARKSAGK